MDKQKIIDKIEKLMRKTREAGASEAESETAIRAARKLMDEYNVELAEVMAAADSAAKDPLSVDNVVEQVCRENNTAVTFERLLMWVVCFVCDCKWYKQKEIKSGPFKRKRQLVLYGFERDVVAARALWIELSITVKAMARAHLGKGWSSKHLQYANGFAYGLYDKAKAMKDERERKPVETSDCTALIVRKKEDALTTYGEEKLQLAKGRSHMRPVDSNFALGNSHGRQHDLKADRSQKLKPQPKRRIG